MSGRLAPQARSLERSAGRTLGTARLAGAGCALAPSVAGGSSLRGIASGANRAAGGAEMSTRQLCFRSLFSGTDMTED